MSATNLRFRARFDVAPELLADARIAAFDGTEELHRPARFAIECDCLGEVAVSDVQQLLQENVFLRFGWVDGAGAAVASGGKGDVVRSLFVTRAEHLGTNGAGFSRIRIVAEDAIALLGYGRRTRQHAQPIDLIVKQLLDELGLISETSQSSEVTVAVQWQETDLDFVLRLLAGHGMYLCCRPTHDDGPSAVCAIGAGLGPIGSPSDALLAEFAEPGSKRDPCAIVELRHGEGLVPSAYQSWEHTDEDPGFSATAEAPSRAVAKAQIDHPDVAHRPLSAPGKILRGLGRAPPGADGAQLAWRGRSAYPNLYAGRCINLTGCPMPDPPEELIAISVRHVLTEQAGSAGTYRNEFTALPAARMSAWAPWPVPPAPRVHGIRLGVIAGNDVVEDPAGYRYASLEGCGAYSVRFPSERDRDGTELVQVARLVQPTAGNGRGFHAPPQVGDEVAVACLDGDPDRPVILGALYSQANFSPPTAVADGATTSSVWRTHTGHELRFDDAGGSERIRLVTGTLDHALELSDADKKVHLKTAGEMIEEIAVDRTSTVGGDQSDAVTGDLQISVGGSENLSIDKDLLVRVAGDEKRTVDGARETGVAKDSIEKIGGDAERFVSKDATEAIDGEYNVSAVKAMSFATQDKAVLSSQKAMALSSDDALGITVAKKATVTADGITLDSQGDIVIKAGSASITLKKSGDIIIKGSKVKIEGSGDVVIKGSKTGIN